jgi:dUTPase
MAKKKTEETVEELVEMNYTETGDVRDPTQPVMLDQIQLDSFEVKVHGKHGLVPKQAEPGSAGYDLYAPPGNDIHMPFDSRRMVDTGVIVQTPIKLFMLLVPRSSTGTKRARSVRIANTVGIIDPSYQGKDDTLKVYLERGARRKTYVGTFESSPGLGTNMAQAQRKFGVAMSPDQTELISVGPNNQPIYDVFTHQEKPMDTMVVEAGSRFAQVIFIPYARPDLVEATLEHFDQPSRDGFGSTGK